MRLNSFLRRAFALAFCVTAFLVESSWAQTPRDPNAPNSYEAPESFKTGPQLKAHIERLQRVPVTQRSTGNYYEQYVKTADRILEMSPPESLREFAVIHLLDGLQQWADVGKDAEADKRLAEVAEKYRNDPNKRVAIATTFFILEQRLLNPSTIPADQVPKVLDEVKAALGSRGLTAKYVRIANGTNTLINYLGTDEEAEKRFKEFGRIFTASSDATISKLGNTMKTAKRDVSLRTAAPAATVAEAATITPDGSAPAEKAAAAEPADKWTARMEAQLPKLGGAANDAVWEKEKTAFMAAYPESPLRWQWYLMEARRAVNNPTDRMQGMSTAKGALSTVVYAPDAPAPVRELASVMKLRLDVAARLNPPELVSACDEHMKAFPNSMQNASLAAAVATAVTFDRSEEDGLAMLEQLKATGAAPVVAAATARMAIMEKLIQLKSNPLELKFAALDGKEFDLEKLRGKVVLIDFGATWSKPWVDGLPELKEMYKKYHDEGLEIVSISLDQDKPALETIVKSQELPWVHFFDGKVWETPPAKTYGINSLPALWLVGKDGKVIDFRARDQLPAKLEPLMQ